MVARALLQVAQDAVSNAATSAGNAAEFWDQFVPQQPSPINADSAAGLIIGFILTIFIIGCIITKVAGMASQIEVLENRMTQVFGISPPT
mmetsp:Transcript_9001/g.25865  ORF Transcript_9001/g.25865 Transcript_9001/m.25865 type:complete len:90 (+) Transcript_9001:149-418(+)